jgi:hypothetical protein
LSCLGHDARFQEQLDQSQDAFVSDPPPHASHDGRVRQLVEEIPDTLRASMT